MRLLPQRKPAYVFQDLDIRRTHQQPVLGSCPHQLVILISLPMSLDRCHVFESALQELVIFLPQKRVYGFIPKRIVAEKKASCTEGEVWLKRAETKRSRVILTPPNRRAPRHRHSLVERARTAARLARRLLHIYWNVLVSQWPARHISWTIQKPYKGHN